MESSGQVNGTNALVAGVGSEVVIVVGLAVGASTFVMDFSNANCCMAETLPSKEREDPSMSEADDCNPRGGAPSREVGRATIRYRETTLACTVAPENSDARNKNCIVNRNEELGC
jgi:hypothetical protein